MLTKPPALADSLGESGVAERFHRAGQARLEPPSLARNTRSEGVETMKRLAGILAMQALVGVTFTASAHEMHAAPAAKDSAAVTKADLPPAPVKGVATGKAAAPAAAAAAPAPKPSAPASITGEIVDAGCYLGHGERG